MKMKEKMKYMKSNFKVIEKQYRDIIHQYQVVYCYLDTKKRERCMEDLKDEAKKLFRYIDQYRSVNVKDLAKQNCYNFLNVLYEDVDYDNSINDYCHFIQSSNRKDCDYSYDTLKDKFLACKTIIVSYFNIKKVASIDLKLYNMQVKLLELIKMID